MGLVEKAQALLAQLQDPDRPYLVARVESTVDGLAFSKNTVVPFLAGLLERPLLMEGCPQFGKTTTAELMLSILTGLPADLYATVKHSGHAEQAVASTVGRYHFGMMANEGIEKVIWQLSMLLPGMLFDDVSRNPERVQNLILEGVRTGRWNLYNDSLMRPAKGPMYFTRNPDGNQGNTALIEALRERIAISVDFPTLGPLRNLKVDNCESRIAATFHCQDGTQKLLDAVRESNGHEIGSIIEKVRQEFIRQLHGQGIESLTADEITAAQKDIKSVKITSDALVFPVYLEADINLSRKFGMVRPDNGVISDETHDKKYAGYHVLTPMIPKAREEIWAFAKALAWLQGKNEVSIQHVRYFAPLVLAHRLRFTETYKSEVRKEVRQGIPGLLDARESEQVELACRLTETVYERFEGLGRKSQAKENVKLLVGMYYRGELTLEKLKGYGSALTGMDQPIFHYLTELLDEKQPFYRRQEPRPARS